MKIVTSSNIIGSFLENSAEKLIVPRYQRPYSWNKENLKELIDDIKKSKGEDDAHFIGTIIRSIRESDGCWEIVDGQQRLTSISILLAAMRDVYIEENPNGSEVIATFQKYIKPTNFLTRSFYKISHETEDKCFTDNYKLIIDNRDLKEREDGFTRTTEAGCKVIEAYDFFKDELRKIISEEMSEEDVRKHSTKFYTENPREIQRKMFFNKVIYLKFVDINMQNTSEAYRVFNILNSRGMKLKQAELIKSHILGHLHHKDGVDLSRRDWECINNSVVEHNKKMEKNNPEKNEKNNKNNALKISEDNFFYHYLVSIGNIPKSKKYTFAEYERMINTSDDARKMLKKLKYEIELYRVIFDPDHKAPSESHRTRNKATWPESLKALNKLDLVQPHPLILALLRRYFNSDDKAVRNKEMNEILDLMERAHFMLTAIHREPGNKFTNTYNTQAKKIFNLSRESGKSKGNMKINEVREKLEERYSDLMKNLTQEVFVNEFIEKMDYSKDSGKMKYFLMKYQPDTLGKTGDNLTVEHIIPQAKIDDLVEILIANNPEGSNIKEEERERVRRVVGSPGNLIILRGNDNEGIKDEDIKEKIKFYNTLSYASTLPVEIVGSEADNGESNKESIFKNISLKEADENLINDIFEKINKRSVEMARTAYNEIFSIKGKNPEKS